MFRWRRSQADETQPATELAGTRVAVDGAASTWPTEGRPTWSVPGAWKFPST
jgi:hypothetical protein